MPFRPHVTMSRGFTLLEICIAMAIAALVVTAAIPSLQGVLNGDQKDGKFSDFDSLVQEAHRLSVTEKRAYLLVWTPKYVKLRPDDVPDADMKNTEGSEREWAFEPDEKLRLFLTAALTPNPEAVWTFWPNGTCEPADVEFKGPSGNWTARYNPFTIKADVTYE